MNIVQILAFLIFLSSANLEAKNNGDTCANLPADLPVLCTFLDTQLQEIEKRLRRDIASTTKKPLIDPEHEFILVGPPTELEYTQAIANITNVIQQKLKTISDKNQRLALKKQLEIYVDKLADMSDSLANVTLRISDNPDAFYQKYVDSGLTHLTNLGVDPKGAYEILRFDRKNRYTITPEAIIERSDNLHKEYGGTTTPEGKQVRQAKFTLQNQFGKELYDAFLTGPEALEMLRIPTSDAELFYIDFTSLFNEILTYKNELDTLIKELSR